MPASLTDRAQGRASAAEAAVRDALAAGQSQHAINLALGVLQSELAKLRRRRPGDGALTDAELAGSLLAIAVQLHAHKPRRVPGTPRIPRPADLDRAFTNALEGGEHG